MTELAQMSLMLEDPGALLAGFAERSQQLQHILRQAGYQRPGSAGAEGFTRGVSVAGLRLVSRVATRAGLSDWPHITTWADYDALIAAVLEEIQHTPKTTHDIRSH